jgi:hypothetical protein
MEDKWQSDSLRFTRMALLREVQQRLRGGLGGDKA